MNATMPVKCVYEDCGRVYKHIASGGTQGVSSGVCPDCMAKGRTVFLDVTIQDLEEWNKITVLAVNRKYMVVSGPKGSSFRHIESVARSTIPANWTISAKTELLLDDVQNPDNFCWVLEC